jgi:peptidyl-prolyl cis-trans isomerase B (cyclophilin B)
MPANKLKPTNNERRATAKVKLEHRLAAQARQAHRRRILTIAASSIAGVVALTAVVASIVLADRADKHKMAPSARSRSAPASGPLAGVPPLPPFKASADAGADCEYPLAPQPAGRPVDPPQSGKVSTDPAQARVSIMTNQGPIGLLLTIDQSPCTVNNFVNLAKQKFFDSTHCHRLSTSPTLGVLQCGDPNGDGTGGPGYQFANEYPTDQYSPDDPKVHQPVVYPRGTVAMANTGPGTNGSQFMLVYKNSRLPPEYTVFGKLDEVGLATLGNIAKAGVSGGSQDGPPVADATIESLRLG